MATIPSWGEVRVTPVNPFRTVPSTQHCHRGSVCVITTASASKETTSSLQRHWRWPTAPQHSVCSGGPARSQALRPPEALTASQPQCWPQPGPACSPADPNAHRPKSVKRSSSFFAGAFCIQLRCCPVYSLSWLN